MREHITDLSITFMFYKPIKIIFIPQIYIHIRKRAAQQHAGLVLAACMRNSDEAPYLT